MRSGYIRISFLSVLTFWVVYFKGLAGIGVACERILTRTNKAGHIAAVIDNDGVTTGGTTVAGVVVVVGVFLVAVVVSFVFTSLCHFGQTY